MHDTAKQVSRNKPKQANLRKPKRIASTECIVKGSKGSEPNWQARSGLYRCLRHGLRHRIQHKCT